MPVPLVGNFVGLVAVERCRDAQVGLRVGDEFDVVAIAKVRRKHDRAAILCVGGIQIHL